MIIFGSWRGAAAGIPFALVFVLTTVTAISVRQYRDQAAAERARAEQTARLAELDRAQAVTAERNRMARELHDVIANHMSAIAIHATALLSVRDLAGRARHRRTAGDPREQRARPGRDAGRWSSCCAIRAARRRRRRDPAPAGRRARCWPSSSARPGSRSTWPYAGRSAPLPVSVDLAAYRILQESLTNALKHGGGRAEVEHPLRSATVVRLDVRSDLGRAGSAVPGSGAGIIGMRERAELLGGRLTAGPEDGRWRVRAELPTGRGRRERPGGRRRRPAGRAGRAWC